MNKKVLFTLPLLALTLTSCETDYETFKEKAEAANEKEHQFTKGSVTIKGNYKEGDTLTKVNEKMSLKYSESSDVWSIDSDSISKTTTGFAVGLIVTGLVNVRASNYAITDDENIKYYSSMGELKIVGKTNFGDTTISFNSYGLIKKCSIKSEDDSSNRNLSITFSYNK